jgi:hypothetical protein
MKNKPLLLKIAYILGAIKKVDGYGKYRLLHPLTQLYIPYLLILFYQLSLISPSYKLSDLFCWW